jgi:hypothetical protein
MIIQERSNNDAKQASSPSARLVDDFNFDSHTMVFRCALCQPARAGCVGESFALDDHISRALLCVEFLYHARGLSA